jgi:hypothetical protein
MSALLDLGAAVDRGFARVDGRFAQMDVRLAHLEGQVAGLQRWTVRADERFDAFSRD